MDCIFCKIIAGEIPSHTVYKDEKIIAFLDIAPVNNGHILVIPRAHYANLEEIPEGLLCDLMKVVKRIGHALKSGLGVEGYNVQENNDPVAGQIIPHIHWHIIPRNSGDGLKLWPQHKYETGQAEGIIKKIKSKL